MGYQGRTWFAVIGVALKVRKVTYNVYRTRVGSAIHTSFGIGGMASSRSGKRAIVITRGRVSRSTLGTTVSGANCGVISCGSRPCRGGDLFSTFHGWLRGGGLGGGNDYQCLERARWERVYHLVSTIFYTFKTVFYFIQHAGLLVYSFGAGGSPRFYTVVWVEQVSGHQVNSVLSAIYTVSCWARGWGQQGTILV